MEEKDKSLTVLIGVSGNPDSFLPTGLSSPSAKKLFSNALQELGIEADINDEGLNLITFKNDLDLHWFLVSGFVKNSPVESKTWNGYKVYEWAK